MLGQGVTKISLVYDESSGVAKPAAEAAAAGLEAQGIDVTNVIPMAIDLPDGSSILAAAEADDAQGVALLVQGVQAAQFISAADLADSDLIIGSYDLSLELGLRYLASSVRKAGFDPRIVTYQSDPAELVALARTERPLAIGLSLIFQYMAPSFAAVIAANVESMAVTLALRRWRANIKSLAEAVRRPAELTDDSAAATR